MSMTQRKNNLIIFYVIYKTFAVKPTPLSKIFATREKSNFVYNVGTPEGGAEFCYYHWQLPGISASRNNELKNEPSISFFFNLLYLYTSIHYKSYT